MLIIIFGIVHKCGQIDSSILLGGADVLKALSSHDGVASATCEHFLVKEACYSKKK
jgi:hypothetical protein